MSCYELRCLLPGILQRSEIHDHLNHMIDHNVVNTIVCYLIDLLIKRVLFGMVQNTTNYFVLNFIVLCQYLLPEGGPLVWNFLWKPRPVM